MTKFKHALFFFVLGAIPAASAQTPSPAPSETPQVLVLPTPVINEILGYLAARPYSEVAQSIADIQRCVQDQIPGKDGKVQTRGNCPEIATTLNRIAAAPNSPQTDAHK